MEFIQKLINWSKVKGKLLALYILLTYLAISPFIKQIPKVSQFLPDDKYVIPTIATCLFLMVQIFMAMFKGDEKEISLKKFEDSSENFKKRLMTAKNIDILCSSSETFYPILKDCFATQKIVCRMLLRHPLKGIEKQKKDMLHYSDTYSELKEENQACNLTIRYSKDTFSRMIIIDNVEVYFGFYKLEKDRLRAKNIEMIHAKTGNYFGNFILNIAINRFDSVWDCADEVMSEREKLIC